MRVINPAKQKTIDHTRRLAGLPPMSPFRKLYELTDAALALVFMTYLSFLAVLVYFRIGGRAMFMLFQHTAFNCRPKTVKDFKKESSENERK